MMYGSWLAKEILMGEDSLIIESKILHREVTCSLLFPDEYNKAFPLNLLLLNDGQNMSSLQVKKAMEELLAHQYMGQTVVVGIHAQNRLQEYGTVWAADYQNRGRLAPEYMAFVVQELLPELKAYWRIHSFGITAIAGCGLGAVSAFDIAWNNPDLFDKVGAFSGAFWWRSKGVDDGYREDRDRIVHQMVNKTAGKPDLKLWFEAGTHDELSDRNKNGINDVIDDTTDLIRVLEQKGFSRPHDIQYVELVGGRGEVSSWATALPKFLKWAFYPAK